MDSLMEVFKILNEDDHRKARRTTYKVFKEYESGILDAFSKKGVEGEIAKVRADMDQMGTLVHHNLIPRKVFLEAYWNTILVCWKALENNIEQERIRRQYPTYMKYFQELKDQARRYWKKYHTEVRHIDVY
jgi:hypothetical protein